MGIIYITGGAKSGKSNFAENLATKKDKKKIYLATSKIYDLEIEDKVKKHQISRGDSWKTIEAYKDLPSILMKFEDETILIDCLTMMITNLIFDYETDFDDVTTDKLNFIENKIITELDKLINFSKNYKGDIIIVSNEIGLGIVPINRLSRYFREIAGLANQKIAKASKEAYMIISGLPIKLK